MSAFSGGREPEAVPEPKENPTSSASTHVNVNNSLFMGTWEHRNVNNSLFIGTWEHGNVNNSLSMGT
jgi:hypothetical protein